MAVYFSTEKQNCGSIQSQFHSNGFSNVYEWQMQMSSFFESNLSNDKCFKHIFSAKPKCVWILKKNHLYKRKREFWKEKLNFFFEFKKKKELEIKTQHWVFKLSHSTIFLVWVEKIVRAKEKKNNHFMEIVVVVNFTH